MSAAADTSEPAAFRTSHAYRPVAAVEAADTHSSGSVAPRSRRPSYSHWNCSGGLPSATTETEKGPPSCKSACCGCCVMRGGRILRERVGSCHSRRMCNVKEDLLATHRQCAPGLHIFRAHVLRRSD